MRLCVRRIFAICRALGILQEVIHLRMVFHGIAIRPGEEGDRRGAALILHPAVYCAGVRKTTGGCKKTKGKNSESVEIRKCLCRISTAFPP